MTSFMKEPLNGTHFNWKSWNESNLQKSRPETAKTFTIISVSPQIFLLNFFCKKHFHVLAMMTKTFVRSDVTNFSPKILKNLIKNYSFVRVSKSKKNPGISEQKCQLFRARSLLFRNYGLNSETSESYPKQWISVKMWKSDYRKTRKNPLM